MTEQERQNLAERLAKVSYKKARAQVRSLDTQAKLKYWRNAIKHEWHTMYELPNMGLRVTLVEIPVREPISKQGPNGVHLVSVDPQYVEARVEEFKR
jgi:hypothetical protein